MKQKLKKERNPFVQHIRVKRSGAHGKSKKALRRAEKISFKKELKDSFCGRVNGHEDRLANTRERYGILGHTLY